MSAVKAMGKSANACLLVVMSAFGAFAPYLRVLMADDDCSWYLWLLISALEPSLLLKSAHEHSQAHMTRYKHS